MSTLRYIDGRIKNRRDEKTTWSSTNPLLYDGELAVEMDSSSSKIKMKLKCGDGITRWNDLPYISGGGVPVGTILSYAGKDTPEDYLFCNGQAVSRTDYPDLFAVLGSTYGNGDAHSTFNLPNLNGRFLEGNDVAGTFKEAGLPNIVGQLPTGDSNSTYESLVTGAFYSTYSSGRTCGNDSVDWDNPLHRFDASRCSPVYERSDTVQPPSMTVRFIIKAVD